MSESKKKFSFFGSITKYFRDFKSELKKIVWPTPLETTKNTGTVLLSIITIGLFVFALDSLLYLVLNWTMGVANPSALQS